MVEVDQRTMCVSLEVAIQTSAMFVVADCLAFVVYHSDLFSSLFHLALSRRLTGLRREMESERTWLAAVSASLVVQWPVG